ncbi:O-acyltransferase like protein-like [Epargyreus clarus]|uniref:O-acyltransferase like protein-like n=1 Tax=Epargyreus clarus TaxID=520877 RepID=UPI003C2E616F
MKISAMKQIILVVCFFILGNISSVPAVENIKNNPVAKYGHLNILREDLQSLEWGQEEVPCLTLLVKILQNVQNSTLWATWIWDSMQTPGGQLFGSSNNYGNYDECLEFPWEKVHPALRTQYCLAHIHLAKVDSGINDVDLFGHAQNYIQVKTKYNLKFNTLRWGVCTPAVCKPHSVNKFVGALFRQSHLGLAVDKLNISINGCDVAGDTEIAYDFGYYFSGFLITFSIVSTLLGTILVKYEGLHTSSTGLVYAKAYDIARNLGSLVNITPNDVHCLFGIRVISAILIVIVHVGLLINGMGVFNGIVLYKDLEDKWLLLISTAVIAVDTFLFMSGFLLVKSLLANGFKSFSLLKFIVKRYLRLIWPLVVVLFIGFKFLHIPRGPVKSEIFGKELEACNQNWWTTLLMIQNYVDPENMCYPISWSIACDFHLTVFGTIGTWVFMKNRKFGLLMFLIPFIASIVLQASTVISNPETAILPGDFRSMSNYRKYILGNKLYMYTHYRTGSYFIGMATGYLITMYDPVKYRNVISKLSSLSTSGENFAYSHCILTYCFVFLQKLSILSFIALLAMILGFFILDFIMQTVDVNVFMMALYVSLRRIVWATLISILIVLCEYGTLPLVPGLLGWSAWAPFSRLSFGVFLLHVGVILFCTSTIRSNMEYHVWHTVLLMMGVTVASCIISLLLWTLFEEPMRILVTHALRDRNKKNTEEVKGHQNGKNSKNMEIQTNKNGACEKVNKKYKTNVHRR